MLRAALLSWPRNILSTSYAFCLLLGVPPTPAINTIHNVSLLYPGRDDPLQVVASRIQQMARMVDPLSGKYRGKETKIIIVTRLKLHTKALVYYALSSFE